MLPPTNSGGFEQPSSARSVTVGATSIVVAQPRFNRKSIKFRNSSAGGQVITIVKNVVAVANAGDVLSPGDTTGDARSEGYEPFKGSYQAIADGAGAILSIDEDQDP